jgi:hypothetical protein
MKNPYDQIAEKYHIDNAKLVENLVERVFEDPGTLSVHLRRTIIRSLIGWDFNRQQTEIVLNQSELESIDKLEYLAAELWDAHESKNNLNPCIL